MSRRKPYNPVYSSRKSPVTIARAGASPASIDAPPSAASAVASTPVATLPSASALVGLDSATPSSLPLAEQLADADSWWRIHSQLYCETVARQERRAEKRAEGRSLRRAERIRAFGDLCETTKGRAVVWRRERVSPQRIAAFAATVEDMWLKQTLLRWLRLTATREIDRHRHAERRASYYEAERERRQSLAKARREVTRRYTENPCPTKEQVLAAWMKARESDEDLIRFGSLMEDLECYVDNTLNRDESGAIVGRNGGIKEWLAENIPALRLRYSTVMRYKAAARKLRQLTELGDPVPAALIVEGRTSATTTNSATDTATNATRTDASITKTDDENKDATKYATTVRTKSIDGLQSAAQGQDERFKLGERGDQVQPRKRGDQETRWSLEGQGGQWEQENRGNNENRGDRGGQECRGKQWNRKERGDCDNRGDCGNQDGIAEVLAELSARTRFAKEVLRARAIYAEFAQPRPTSRTAFMARLDAYLDPERVDETTTLRRWKEKYADEITVRTKFSANRSSKRTNNNIRIPMPPSDRKS